MVETQVLFQMVRWSWSTVRGEYLTIWGEEIAHVGVSVTRTRCYTHR